ncbi:MAG: CDP-alcohol phosphatidyltransferase family protein [Rhodospirillales bacterium]|nr:CDP-alcohol phosphatidyltransferase family protein [Alphaproteobacteria bacterium]MBL6947472.1 CDP-alcohol phosphatidyltransferase family protein [Rhodospirillales bacterium]
MNLPNFITLARLAAVPFLVWLILNGALEVAFWVFLAAAVSDALDGIIAKQFDMETVFGAFIDPIADKALLVASYITLGHEGLLPMWLVILVVFRDIVIIGGALVFQTVTQSLTMQPLMISKVNTVMQLLLALGVLFIEGYGIEDGPAVAVMGYIVAVTTLWSGTVYVVTWSRMAAEMENAGDGET